MRWLPFAILAYLAVGLQVGAAHPMEWRGASPDLVLIAVVFIALHAPRNAALLAAFILGAMQDITSLGPTGLYAFTYGLAALLILRMRQTLYRRHAATHFLTTLFAGLLTAFVLALHSRFRAHTGWIFYPRCYAALYTALLAPILIHALQHFQKIFQFQSNAPRKFPTRAPH